MCSLYSNKAHAIILFQVIPFCQVFSEKLCIFHISHTHYMVCQSRLPFFHNPCPYMMKSRFMNFLIMQFCPPHCYLNHLKFNYVQNLLSSHLLDTWNKLIIVPIVFFIDVKLSFLHQGKNIDWRCLGKGFWGEYSDLREMKWGSAALTMRHPSIRKSWH
jgi:hypothetical protein